MARNVIIEIIGRTIAEDINDFSFSPTPLDARSFNDENLLGDMLQRVQESLGVALDPAQVTSAPLTVPSSDAGLNTFGLTARSFDDSALTESLLVPAVLEDDHPFAAANESDELRSRNIDDGAGEVIRIWSNPMVETCQLCIGSSAKGGYEDVARLLNSEQLARLGARGDGVYVAVVDTGINLKYLESIGLKPKLDASWSWNPDSTTTAPGEHPVNHGTMCAFDVCITAPNCTLVDMAVLLSKRKEPDENGGSSSVGGLLSDAVVAYNVLRARLREAAATGSQPSLVVTNSWGLYDPNGDFPIGHESNYSHNPEHPFNRIVGALEAMGADILFAAGNCGAQCPDNRCHGQTEQAIYGANGLNSVLCVGGVDISGERVGYSSIGPAPLSPVKPDICGYTHFQGSGVNGPDSGTSAATPVVAGLIAAIRSRFRYDINSPATSPAALRVQIRSTAQSSGQPGVQTGVRIRRHQQ